MIFRRSQSRRRLPRYPVELVGEYRHSIARQSFHQRELDQLAGGRTEEGHEIETTAEIVLDDRDRGQDRAVCIDNRTVGCLPAQDARKYLEWLKEEGYREGAILECPALISGGWDRGRTDRGPYRVQLDLSAIDLNAGE